MFRIKRQQVTGPIKERLNAWADKQQHKAGSLLNQKTGHWSRDTQKVFLILVCLAFGAAITTMLFSATPPPQVTHINLPLRVDSLPVKDSLFSIMPH